MLEKLLNTEVEYMKNFSQYYESDNTITFTDDCIPDMYTHNFILIKKNIGTEKIKDIIFSELEKRIKNGLKFLRVEFSFSIDLHFISELPIKGQITKYDYMFADPMQWKKLNANSESVVKKATSKTIMNDGIKVDVLANEPDMGNDFATRRIIRKAEVYKQSNNLNLYVCYYEKTPIGNCELMYDKQIAKIEDFDILGKYQRKGFGTSVLKYLLKEASEKGTDIVYLITESEDAAREMYAKCGFRKAGEKIELMFHFN